MDALASIVFSGIIMHTIHHLGYEDLKQKTRLTATAGVIAGFGLLIVYGGFIYLGASASGQAIQDLSRVELLIRVIDQILGSWGSIGLGIIVALACLTTAVGLTATVAMYFSDRSSKLSYKPMVYIICIFLPSWQSMEWIPLSTSLLRFCPSSTLLPSLLSCYGWSMTGLSIRASTREQHSEPSLCHSVRWSSRQKIILTTY